jgi:hypothetical protein
MINNHVTRRKKRSRAAWTLCLIGMALAAGVLGAAAQGIGTPYTFPTPRPTPMATCADGLRERLIVRERGRVSFGDARPLNVRDGPGTSYTIIGQIEPGGVFVVLEGATCSARYVWYRVARGSLSGWVAESDGSGYFVEPYPPGG